MSTTAPHNPPSLDALEPGTSVRFRTANGPGIALKGNDGLWAVPGNGKVTAEQLWAYGEDITVLGSSPSWARAV